MDFDMSVRETISLMATHGLGCQRHNYVQSAKYRWFGAHALSNMYFKYLNGKMYRRGDPLKSELGRDYFVGDKFGQPVGGTGWRIHCHGAWNTSTPEAGPCDFRPSQVGCRPNDDPDKDLREDCFDKINGVWQKKPSLSCSDAELDPITLIQTGGGRSNGNLCKDEGWSFGLPFEVNFVVNFTVDGENRPRGCGPLDGDHLVQGYEDWRTPDHAIYPGSPGVYGAPPCGYQMYAPEGETTADIVASFADDHDLWARVFLDAWQKMQRNGYSPHELKNGPSNSWLLSWMKPLNPLVVNIASLLDPSKECSESGSSLSFRKVHIQNVKNNMVLTGQEDGSVGLTALDVRNELQQWQIGLLCSGKMRLVNGQTGLEMSGGPWTYDQDTKLLKGDDGRWAKTDRKKRYRTGGRIRWFDQGKDPWRVFQWKFDLA